MTTHDPGKDAETGYHILPYLQKISIPNLINKAIRSEQWFGTWLIQMTNDRPGQVKEVIDAFQFDEKGRDASKSRYLLATLEADPDACLKTRDALYEKFMLNFVNGVYIATKSFFPLTERVDAESAMNDLEALLQAQLSK